MVARLLLNVVALMVKVVALAAAVMMIGPPMKSTLRMNKMRVNPADGLKLPNRLKQQLLDSE